MESSVLLVFVTGTALLTHPTFAIGEGEEQTWLSFVPVYLFVVDTQFRSDRQQNCEYINELIEFIMSYQEKFRIPNKFTFFDLLMTESFQARFFAFKGNLSFPIQKSLKTSNKTNLTS